MHNMGWVMGFEWVCPIWISSETLAPRWKQYVFWNRLNHVWSPSTAWKHRLKIAKSDIVHYAVKSVSSKISCSDFQRLALARPDCKSAGRKSCSVFQFLALSAFGKPWSIPNGWIKSYSKVLYLEKHHKEEKIGSFYWLLLKLNGAWIFIYASVIYFRIGCQMFHL